MIQSASTSDGQQARPPLNVRVLRQDRPDGPSYWERHAVEHSGDMNVISVLQRVAEQTTTADGRSVAPVAWDCNCLEEVCGACTMMINGTVRQACSALVDRLVEDNPSEIELRPMSKFPVVRDLVVDRSRLFRSLEKVKAWVAVDGYFDQGPGPRQSEEDQETSYPLSQCMSCGCCLDACPQYTKVELVQREDESDEAFATREQAAFDHSFVGAAAISQAVLFNTNPTGKMNASERLATLAAPGGLHLCGNAQNCVAVCPKEIPLTTSIARAGRAMTVNSLTKWFDR
jgi:succinate dehydrogenase / fumarate reductase iron-sulfur subunit